MIAIQTAFNNETAIIVKKFNLKKLKKKPYLTYSGKIDSNKVIVVEGGVGKVFSAASTQYIISEFKPELIINAGVCGSLDNNIKIGNIIFAIETEEHDFNYEKPVTVWKQKTEILKIFKQKFKDIFFGKIVSADTNVELTDHRNKLVKKYNAYGADWESGAIAKVCKKNKVNCIILRAVSDMADENFETDFIKNTIKSMNNITDILADIIGTYKMIK